MNTDKTEIQKLIDQRKKWLSDNRIESWTDSDTEHVALAALNNTPQPTAEGQSIEIPLKSIRSNYERWKNDEIDDGAFSWHLHNNLLRIEAYAAQHHNKGEEPYFCNRDCPDSQYGNCCHPDTCERPKNKPQGECEKVSKEVIEKTLSHEFLTHTGVSVKGAKWVSEAAAAILKLIPRTPSPITKEQIVKVLEDEVNGLWKTTDVLIDHQATAILNLIQGGEREEVAE